MKLYSRDEFRRLVFERSRGICSIPWCKKEGVDAHHIIERRLWDDEGYYLENGACLCEEHHRLAERNIIIPTYLRMWNNIIEVALPSKLNPDKDWNKWGQALPMPNRLRPKYPSTFYFPFSPIPKEHTKDVGNVESLVGVPLVITKKMDGSNVKLTSEFVAARNSINADHKSFDMLKAFHSTIKHMIAPSIDLFGEWLYAKHSIHYKKENAVPNYLMLFAAYDTKQRLWLQWQVIESIATHLNIPTVPVIEMEVVYDKKWQLEKSIKEIGERVIQQGHEGIVVRSCYGFHYSQLSDWVMKYVRPNHVQTDKHWMSQPIIKNEMKK